MEISRIFFGPFKNSKNFLHYMRTLIIPISTQRRESFQSNQLSIYEYGRNGDDSDDKQLQRTAQQSNTNEPNKDTTEKIGSFDLCKACFLCC